MKVFLKVGQMLAQGLRITSRTLDGQLPHSNYVEGTWCGPQCLWDHRRFTVGHPSHQVFARLLRVVRQVLLAKECLV
jgi:hypothetical protein